MANTKGKVVNPASSGRPHVMTRDSTPVGIVQQFAAVCDPTWRCLTVHGFHLTKDIVGIAHDRVPLKPEGDAAPVRRSDESSEISDLQKPAGRDRFRVRGTSEDKHYNCRYHNRLDEHKHWAFLEGADSTALGVAHAQDVLSGRAAIECAADLQRSEEPQSELQ